MSLSVKEFEIGPYFGVYEPMVPKALVALPSAVLWTHDVTTGDAELIQPNVVVVVPTVSVE